MRFDYGYDKSYGDVPRRYHVVCVIPRGDQGVLVQRRHNEAEYSLPTYSYDPQEVSLMKKVHHVIPNYGLQLRNLKLLQFDELWQPKIECKRVSSVDVYYGVLLEGAEQMRVASPHLQLIEVNLGNVKTTPISGLSLSGECESWRLNAQARLLFDALSVLSSPFFKERESFERVDEIGFELSSDVFSLVFEGAYLGIYRAGFCQYYHRLDPLEPLGRRVGPLESLVASGQS